MSVKSSVGEQLDGQALYARQKMLRATHKSSPAPAIVAVGLAVPENIGSVLRLADAAGSERVIFVNHTAQDLKRIRRTARHCEAFVKWEFCAPEKFAESIPSLQPLIALELTTHSTSIFETRLPNECAFVMGSEKHGIPLDLLNACEQAVHIPMYGINGSMNVTHALAIALFEWRRQHGGGNQTGGKPGQSVMVMNGMRINFEKVDGETRA